MSVRKVAHDENKDFTDEEIAGGATPGITIDSDGNTQIQISDADRVMSYRSQIAEASDKIANSNAVAQPTAIENASLRHMVEDRDNEIAILRDQLAEATGKVEAKK